MRGIRIFLLAKIYNIGVKLTSWCKILICEGDYDMYKGVLMGIMTGVMVIAASGVSKADNYELTWYDYDSDGVAESGYFNSDGSFTLSNEGLEASLTVTALDDIQGMGVDTSLDSTEEIIEEFTGTVSGVVDSAASARLTAISSATTLQSGRSDIVNFARQFAGVGILRYGTGNTLSGPADCSGFVQAVFRTFGISLPRTSREQAASAPRYVSEAEMLPGDLIFYGSSIGTVDHVAIYTGNNSIVHATNSRRGWVFEDYGSAMYYENIAAIGRYW